MIANAYRLAMILIIVASAIVYYVFMINRASNHSGLSLYWVYVLVLPAALHFLGQLKYSKYWLIPLAFGLLIIVGVALLDYFNIMLQYDTWLQRGMPERLRWSVLH
jgi:hypothetical protein